MYLDVLENLSKYTFIYNKIEVIQQFIINANKLSLSDNLYSIDGENVYAIINRNIGRNIDNAKLESHNKYIDIHYLISGEETIGWSPVSICKDLFGAYNNEKDIQFYTDLPVNWLKLQPNMFVIFNKDDAHMPSISSNPVDKIVIKIQNDLILN